MAVNEEPKVAHTETWKLVYSFHSPGSTTITGLSREDAETRLADLERMVRKPLLWARIEHTVTTTTTYVLRTSEEENNDETKSPGAH